MEQVLLSPEQLATLTEMVNRDGYRRIVIENTNFENTIAVRLDGRLWLLHTNGTAQELIASA